MRSQPCRWSAYAQHGWVDGRNVRIDYRWAIGDAGRIRKERRAATQGKIDGREAANLRPMRLALYEPDIPQNAGTMLRLAACLGVEAHIVEPAGFPVSDRAFRRAGMDYLDQVSIVRHASFADFESWRRQDGGRLILFTTRGGTSYLDHAFRADDVLMFGRESAGVPEHVHVAANARLVIPIRLRSLNVAVAAAMALGEALRQTGGFAGHSTP